MGRRRAESVAVPHCPKGHERSDVVRAGTYGRGEARRQLWWCRPTDGEAAHRFSERLPRTKLTDGGHTCAECETRLEVFEGPQHPRNYEHAARTIAQTLMLVGAGDTYRHAASVARSVTGWSKAWGQPVKSGANGTLAGDWVAAFGPVVTAPVLEGQSWPSAVALDELPFLSSVPGSRGRAAKAAQWVIWGAYAHPGRSAEGGYLFRLGVSGKLNAEAAAAWLRSIPGRPEYVVCDGTKLWPKAVSLAWPPVVDLDTGEVLADTPRLLPCRWHLVRSLREQLRDASVLPPRGSEEHYQPAPKPRKRTGVSRLRVQALEPSWYGEYRIALSSYPDPESHPLVVAAGRAMNSVEAWDAFRELAEKWQARGVVSWMNRNDWVRADIATRPSGLPLSIGGLEAQLAKIRDRIRPRSKVLRNVVRTQRMLDLMTVHARSEAHLDAYSERVRAHLQRENPPAQRAGVTGGPHFH